MIRGYRPVARGTEFSLLLIPSLLAVIGLILIVLAPRNVVDWTWGEIWVSIAFSIIVLGISALFSLRGFQGDQLLLPITAMLSVIGLLMIQRLSPDLTRLGPDYAGLARNQMIYLAGGMGVLWIIGMLAGPLRIMRLLRDYKYLWMMLTILLQVSTFFIGQEVGEAKLWIRVGPVSIQPSEVVKVTLIVFLASYLDEKRDLIGSSWRLGRISLPPLPYLAPMGAIWVFALGVLVLLNDLGSALLLFGLFVIMLYVATGRLLYVSVALLSFLAACYVAWKFVDRIDIRVQNWIDPWAKDPYYTGYQQIQSDYALSAGGILGTGFGHGRPALIPQVHSDFIFSAIGEELGLLGTLAILALYLLLVVRGFIIALRARDGFVQLLAMGLSSIFAIQTLIIVGGVTRLIPLTGITLPFISFGGSSLMVNFVVIGLLLYLSSLPKRI